MEADVPSRKEASHAVPIPFEEFRCLVAEGLEVEEEKVVQEASFVEDLLADSIQLVELPAAHGGGWRRDPHGDGMGGGDGGGRLRAVQGARADGGLTTC